MKKRYILLLSALFGFASVSFADDVKQVKQHEADSPLYYSDLRSGEGAEFFNMIVPEYISSEEVMNDRELLPRLYRIWPKQTEPFYILLDMKEGLNNGATKKEVEEWLANKDFLEADYITDELKEEFRKTRHTYTNYSFYMDEIAAIFEEYFKGKPESEWPTYRQLEDDDMLLYVKELPYADNAVWALCSDTADWERTYLPRLEESGFFEEGFFNLKSSTPVVDSLPDSIEDLERRVGVVNVDVEEDDETVTSANEGNPETQDPESEETETKETSENQTQVD